MHLAHKLWPTHSVLFGSSFSRIRLDNRLDGHVGTHFSNVRGSISLTEFPCDRLVYDFDNSPMIQDSRVPGKKGGGGAQGLVPVPKRTLSWTY
jgi:hypothetical protein